MLIALPGMSSWSAGYATAKGQTSHWRAMLPLSLATLLATASACVDLDKPWEKGGATDAAAWKTGGAAGSSADATVGEDALLPGGQGGVGGSADATARQETLDAGLLGSGGTTGLAGGHDGSIGPAEAGAGGWGTGGAGGTADEPTDGQGGTGGQDASPLDEANADREEEPDLGLDDTAADVPVVLAPEVTASLDTSGGPDDVASDVPFNGPPDAVVDSQPDVASAPDASPDGAPQPSTTGLLAYYPCEGPGGAPGNLLPDVSGNGNHGTLAVGPAPTGGAGGSGGSAGAGGSGAAHSFAAGRVGNGLALNGSENGYVDLPSGLLDGVHELTIAAWIKVKSTVAFQRVFDFGTDTNNFMYLATANSSNSGPRFRIATPVAGSDAGVSQVLEGTLPIVAGTWTHLTLVLGPNGASIYVNGALQKNEPAVTLRPADLGSSTAAFIGRSQFPRDPYFDGEIDEYRIYARALSDQEIAWLAAQ